MMCAVCFLLLGPNGLWFVGYVGKAGLVFCVWTEKFGMLKQQGGFERVYEVLGLLCVGCYCYPMTESEAFTFCFGAVLVRQYS
jgi:hypothetical protein